MILELSKKEKELLLFVARTGYYCNAYNKYIDTSGHTLNKLLDKKLIEKKSPVIIFGKMMSVSILTQKGKEIVKNKLSVRPYKTKQNQIEHDFVLGKIYATLNEKEKKSWITETDLEIIYSQGSVIDGLYKNKKNERIGVEILTETYKKDIIEKKMSFIKKFCDKKIVIHTNELK